MAYKNNWATGDLIDATAFQELVNSAVYSFTNLSTITSTISSPIDGQIAFAQDTEIAAKGIVKEEVIEDPIDFILLPNLFSFRSAFFSPLEKGPVTALITTFKEAKAFLGIVFVFLIH